MKADSPTVDPIPLRIVRTHVDGGEFNLKSQAVGPPPVSNSLPIGLSRTGLASLPIELIKTMLMQYYIETSTGKKFRSVQAVEQYLSEKADLSSPSSSSPEKKSDQNFDMQMVPLTPGSSDLVLPEGWVVEAHKRVNSAVIDKYYIEPETGRRFRSAVAVKRHLNEACYESVNDTEPESGKKSRSAELAAKKRRNESSKESSVEVRAPRSTNCSRDFVLPDDWLVKTHRRSGFSSHVLDKYYIEPETGRQFRSLVSVERYLKEKEKEDEEYSMRLKDFKRPNKLRVKRKLESKSPDTSEGTHNPESSDSLPTKSDENTTTPKEEVVHDHDSGPSEHSDTLKEKDTTEETEAPKDDFGSPPATLNWVLAGPAGDMWNPYLNEFVVPESTKQKWSEAFVSSLHGADDK